MPFLHWSATTSGVPWSTGVQAVQFPQAAATARNQALLTNGGYRVKSDFDA